jgi:hypothetical protein
MGEEHYAMRALSWQDSVAWLRSERQQQELRATTVATAAVLASFGTALAIEHLARLHVDVVVLAVVLAVTLGRTQRAHAVRQRLLSLLLLAPIAAAAAEVSSLMTRHHHIGDGLFVAAVSAAIWVRRFGPGYAAAGTLATLPFIAVLITPMPPTVGQVHLLWSAVIALVAGCWVSVAQLIDTRLPPRHRPQSHTGGASAGQPAGGSRPRTVPGRLPASTKMAVQMAVALAVAFAVGRQLSPQHWMWLVLTTYIVGSGNRGGGDVAYKSVLRLLGAAAGTVAATAVAGLYPPGDTTPIVFIFVVLALAMWVRAINYAYWAASITAALALLYGYFGQTGATLLRERLAAIAVGAVIGLTAGWFILPVKTTDVVRRRIADVLAVLTDYLSTAHRAPGELPGQQHRLETALDQLEQIRPPLRAHRKLPRRLRDDQPHHDDAVRALLDCRRPTREFTRQLTTAASDTTDSRNIQELRQQVIAARRGMARNRNRPATLLESPPPPTPTQSGPGPGGGALAQLGHAIGVTASVVAPPATADNNGSPHRTACPATDNGAR